MPTCKAHEYMISFFLSNVYICFFYGYKKNFLNETKEVLSFLCPFPLPSFFPLDGLCMLTK